MKKQALFAFLACLMSLGPGPASSQDVEEEAALPAAPAPLAHDENASAAPAAGCFPDCRSGYVCHPEKLECVSICNPPCDRWETCTEEAECVPQGQKSKKQAGEVGDRRFRIVLLGRFGLVGKSKTTLADLYGSGEIEVEGEPGATLGFDLRFEKPVAQYLSVGGLISNYWIRGQRDASGTAAGSFKRGDYAFDIAPFIKPRYPFRAGKKEAEAYLLVNLGASLVLLDYFDGIQTNAITGVYPGFNFGVTPGFQIFVAEHLGLVVEFGYAYSWFKIGRTYISRTRIGQGTLRFGFTVPF
ncbi:MAG: hypothetical protein ACN4G0_17605 [Polyangiales bacterium]